MSPKRGDDVAPPPLGDEWRLRFATNEAAKGWADLCTEAAGNARRCYEALRADPAALRDPDRQHRLRGRLATAMLGGVAYPQWEYEVTAGGRARYLIDEQRRTVHVVYASPGTLATPIHSFQARAGGLGRVAQRRALTDAGCADPADDLTTQPTWP